MLRSESSVVQGSALTLLGFLTSTESPDAFAPIIDAGALSLVVRLHRTSSSEATKRACKLLMVQLMARCAVPSAEAATSASATASASTPAATLTRPKKSCWSCGSTGVPLKKCSVCAVASYCCAGCQKADWKAHKGQCAGLKAGASGSGSASSGR